MPQLLIAQGEATGKTRDIMPLSERPALLLAFPLLQVTTLAWVTGGDKEHYRQQQHLRITEP